MKRGDIIRYVDMTIAEGFSIQRGMNFNIANKEYGIILMSVRPNAPYVRSECCAADCLRHRLF